MKTSTALFVTIIFFATAFWLYFAGNNDANTPETGEANVAAVVEDTPEPTPEAIIRGRSSVTATSTEGINEEYNSIIEGYAAIEDDFNSLGGQETATTSQ